MTEKKTAELNDNELDTVKGGTAKPLFGDDLGAAKDDKIGKPKPKGMERVFEDE